MRKRAFMAFVYEINVLQEWIDHNGHMRDAYYGLVFSFAGVAAQEALGFDPNYRSRTGCSIYLVEDHKFFLREVHLGDPLRVETYVLDSDEKSFHLYLSLSCNGKLCAVAEYMELHVNQLPSPHAATIPEAIQARLRAEQLDPDILQSMRPRAGQIGIRR